MFRKNYLAVLFAAVVLLSGGVAASAQSAPVSGRVVLKKADGTTAPLAGATIDVYRTDVKGKLPSGKTNGKGEFSFAGFPVAGQYMLSVSATGARPDIFPGVRAGADKVLLTLVEGDGRVLTEEEARTAMTASDAQAAAGGGGELTAEQKKQKEEYDKQVAEITARNKKSEESDAIVRKVLEEGGKAFADKNYDLAIAKFDEGIAADPDFVGTTPVLLNNKTAALLNRATARYNKDVKADDATKKAMMEAVKKDLTDAGAASERALTMLKAGTAPTDPGAQKNFEANKTQAIANRKEVYRLMSKTGVDRTKGKEAVAAFQEYLDVTTDAKMKSTAQIALLGVLMDSQESDLAVAEAEKVLAQEPENVEALAVAGLSLVNVGYVSNDKAKLQQGANYLQKYTEVAPANHQYVADAKGLIETLKKEQNVTPSKGGKGATKKKS